MTRKQNYLRFNVDNSALSCGCGVVHVTTREWNVMTEHRRLDIEQAARACTTCKNGGNAWWAEPA